MAPPAPPPPPSPAPEPLKPQKTDYMNLPCPTSYEQIHTDAVRSLIAPHFEGMHADLTKKLNQKFSLWHSIIMGPTEVPSQSAETIKIPAALYQFGADFVDPKLKLVGRVLTDGMVKARVKCVLSKNLSMIGEAKIKSAPGMSLGKVFFVYKGTDYRTLFQIGHADRLGVSYMQSVTPHLSLGGKIMCLESNQHLDSEIGFAARYNTDKMVAAGRITTKGLVNLSYVQKVSEKVSLATDIMVSFMSKNVIARVGYDYRLRECRIRGMIDMDGCAYAYLEKKLNTDLNLTLSAVLDHQKKNYKFGFGFAFTRQVP